MQLTLLKVIDPRRGGGGLFTLGVATLGVDFLKCKQYPICSICHLMYVPSQRMFKIWCNIPYVGCLDWLFEFSCVSFPVLFSYYVRSRSASHESGRNVTSPFLSTGIADAKGSRKRDIRSVGHWISPFVSTSLGFPATCKPHFLE